MSKIHFPGLRTLRLAIWTTYVSVFLHLFIVMFVIFLADVSVKFLYFGPIWNLKTAVWPSQNRVHLKGCPDCTPLVWDGWTVGLVKFRNSNSNESKPIPCFQHCWWYTAKRNGDSQSKGKPNLGAALKGSFFRKFFTRIDNIINLHCICHALGKSESNRNQALHYKPIVAQRNSSGSGQTKSVNFV